MAGFVTKDGEPLMAFGSMGGSVQQETHAQHIVNLAGGQSARGEGPQDPRLPTPTFDRRSNSEDLPVNGFYRAGSDHRKDGQAAGW